MCVDAIEIMIPPRPCIIYCRHSHGLSSDALHLALVPKIPRRKIEMLPLLPPPLLLIHNRDNRLIILIKFILALFAFLIHCGLHQMSLILHLHISSSGGGNY